MVKVRALRNKDGSLNQYIVTLPLVIARALDWVEGDELVWKFVNDSVVVAKK